MLHLGSRGPEVVQFQQALITAGYALPRWGADGVYGKETDGAAARIAHHEGFEKIEGIVSDELQAHVGGRVRLAPTRADDSPPWTRDIRFNPPGRDLGQVNEIIIHEAVAYSVESTVRILKTRKDKETGKLLGLSTHIAIGPDGAKHLTADLNTRAVHCHQHNGPSVGIDLVSPYYPPTRAHAATWPKVITAPWADKGRYTLPTLASIQALVDVVRYLTSPAAGLHIPLRFVGTRPARDGLRFRMDLLDDANNRRPGVWAHHHAGTHADGAWPTLVCYLVLVQGRDIESAYEEAARLATDARGWVPLPSLAEATTAAAVELEP